VSHRIGDLGLALRFGLGNRTPELDDLGLDLVGETRSLEETTQVTHERADFARRRLGAEQVFQQHIGADLVGVVGGTCRRLHQFDTEHLPEALYLPLPGRGVERARTEHHDLAADLDHEPIDPGLVEHGKQVLRPVHHGLAQLRSCAERLDDVHHTLVSTVSLDGLEESGDDARTAVLELSRQLCLGPREVGFPALLRIGLQLGDLDEDAIQPSVLRLDDPVHLTELVGDLMFEDQAGVLEEQGRPLAFEREAGEGCIGLHTLCDLDKGARGRCCLHHNLEVLQDLEAAGQDSATATLAVAAILAAALLAVFLITLLSVTMCHGNVSFCALRFN